MCSLLRLSLIVCVVAACSGCGKSSTPSGPPRIHFPNVSQNLAEIPLAADGRDVEFRFVNRGLSALHITRLVSSCGCAGADVKPPIVAPGAAGKIIVRIAPVQSEARDASVAVHCDDPSNPIVHVSLSWRAVAPLDTEPTLLDFGNVLPGKPITRTVKLRRSSATIREMPCSVTRVDCDPAKILSAVLDDPPADEQTVSMQILRVTLTPEIESGDRRGTIHFNVEKCWRPNLSVAVQWRVQDVVEAAPTSLFLGTGQPGETCSRKVILSAGSGKMLDIERIEFRESDADLQVKLIRLSENRMIAEVQWKFPDAAGHYRNELIVHCTKPENRVVVVPVSAIVLAPMQKGDVQ